MVVLPNSRVVLLGATSLVGLPLLALLTAAGVEVLAISRSAEPGQQGLVRWCGPDVLQGGRGDNEVLSFEACTWISLAPMWVLASYLDTCVTLRPTRVIALSSTSRFSKSESFVQAERLLAARLASTEEVLMRWADERGVPWLILRPTLIHGFGRDQNVAGIARFIQRFGFFPMLGEARGLRRPVHASEVAEACFNAWSQPAVTNQALTISGGEVLSYREMVVRIFAVQNKAPRILQIPRWGIGLGLACLHGLGLARSWSVGMADRMNQDLAYDHEQARKTLGFEPGPFKPETIVKLSQDLGERRRFRWLW